MVKYVVNKIYGNRTERLQLRLNRCQMEGVRLLAAKAGRAPSDLVYALVRDELVLMSQRDERFAKEWDRACAKLVKQGRIE